MSTYGCRGLLYKKKLEIFLPRKNALFFSWEFLSLLNTNFETENSYDMELIHVNPNFTR